MVALLTYIFGILTCTAISLLLTSKEESGEDVFGRITLNNALYTIIFLILFALGFFN